MKYDVQKRTLVVTLVNEQTDMTVWEAAAREVKVLVELRQLSLYNKIVSYLDMVQGFLSLYCAKLDLGARYFFENVLIQVKHIQTMVALLRYVIQKQVEPYRVAFIRSHKKEEIVQSYTRGEGWFEISDFKNFVAPFLKEKGLMR